MEGERVNPVEDLLPIARGLGIGRAHRHILLCAGQTNPKCASRELSDRVWDHLKLRVSSLGLEGRIHADPDLPCVLRNKVDCLRICRGGPIAVVYPEGTWYGGVNEDVLDRILEEHVIGGRPVAEYVIAEAPLDPDAPTAGPPTACPPTA